METLFLVVVTLHCVMGMHGILLDLNLSPRSTRLFTALITLAGGLAILYGIWLSLTVVSLSRF
jgi:succinate dehydrogenase hydrophobic anchor subunit